MTDLVVAAELQAIIRVGVLSCEVGRSIERDATLDEPLAAAAGAALDSTPADVAPARTLYRAIGLDPTRTRPSSEALLRRVRKGEGLPRVNTLVDIGNWCSLEFQLPYGLYDADRIVPPMVLRVGHAGEAYAGIRRDVVHLEGRISLFDATGPFGNPSADSARTMVTVETRQVLAVVYAPASVGAGRMGQILNRTAARLREFAGGRETARQVY